MKLFLDTADYKEIERWLQTGMVDGVTTNPTHLAREGGDPTEKVREICALLDDRDVSVEVTESDPEKVYEQACEIAQLADNVVVKVPCHRDYYGVIERLVAQGIGVNVTLVFSLVQGMMMCKLGVKYISPFIGRLEDNDMNGVELLYDLRDMVDEYQYTTSILAASIRTVDHVHDAIKSGADVATLPASIMEKMTEHVLTDKGMKKFLDDWNKLGVTNFPS